MPMRVCIVKPFPSQNRRKYLEIFVINWVNTKLSKFPKIPYSTIHIHSHKKLLTTFHRSTDNIQTTAHILSPIHWLAHDLLAILLSRFGSIGFRPVIVPLSTLILTVMTNSSTITFKNIEAILLSLLVQTHMDYIFYSTSFKYTNIMHLKTILLALIS